MGVTSQVQCFLRFRVVQQFGQWSWSDGMAWLGQGWQKFTHYYSTSFGQLVVFRYEPSSVFHIVIIDTSTLEIDYPTDPVIVGKYEQECELPLLKKEETDDISAEISEDFWLSPKISKKAKSASASASQKEKSGAISEDGMIRKSACTAIPARPVARGSNVPCPAALETAQGFKSKRPTVILVMYPSYVKKSTGNVSAKFMRGHIKRSVQIVTLKRKKDL